MRAPALALGLLLLATTVSCRDVSKEPHRPSAAAAAQPRPNEAAWVMPMPDLGYNAREGRALFLHYCSTCHGTEGHGDGFNAYSLDPKPRDLGDAAFQKQRTDEEIGAVIRSGGGAAGLSTGMPPWGRTLNDRQIDALICFVRTLTPSQD